jgi:hypothetical protein
MMEGALPTSAADVQATFCATLVDQWVAMGMSWSLIHI